MNDVQAVGSLSALANEQRLAIFRRLVRAGESGMSPGAIAEALGMPPSSLSFHLAQLNEGGMVTQERKHRSITYRANFAAVRALAAYLLENCCEDEGCSAAALEALGQSS